MSENEPQTLTLEDAQEALKAARQQAASYRTKHGNAQNTIQRLTAALKAAGLDPDSDTLEQDAAQLAEAGDATEQLEALGVLSDLFADTLRLAGIEPGDVVSAVQALPEDADDDALTAALSGLTAPLTAPQARLQQQERELAASRLGLSLEDLSEVLGERQPVRQTVQRDGKEVEVFGIGEGDAFKPLDEMRAVQALRSAEHKPEPQRQQFPAQATGGGKPKAPDAVDALNSRLFGGRNASKEQ